MRTPCLFCLVLAATCAHSAFSQDRLKGVPADLVAEIRNPGALPEATYVPVTEWEAEVAPHNMGRVVQDPDASGGAALEATAGKDRAEVLLFGPYLETEPGDYVAFFRLKLLEPSEGDIPGRLDACTNYAQTMLAASDITSREIGDSGWFEVPIGFRYQAGKLECRLTWSGTVGIRADRVSLFRLQDAKLPPTGWRVPQPAPSGEPKDVAYVSEPRPFPDLFPLSSPPADELLVCDLQSERADMRMLIYSLQGLVNRERPSVYCLSVPTDRQWLDHLLERGWVKSTKDIAAGELPARFRADVKGIVIVDAELPATRNIATMIASVKGGLVASPRLAKTLDLPVLDDLRGRWKTSVEAYRWAWDNLWPEMNHHVVACLWPDHLALRDYLVRNRVFIFWLPGCLDGAKEYSRPDEEVRLVEEMLAKMPTNIPVMGYCWAGQDVGIGEGPGVSLFAEFGKYLVGSIDCGNLSVHSGVRVGELKQKPAPPAPTLDESKVYYTFVISDGDNLPVLTSGNFPQLWADKTRGSLPIGWTVSPSASMLIPDIVDFYYGTAAAGDGFIAAVSGVGYTYPDLYGKRFREADRQLVYDGFLDQTAEYMRRSDLRSDWVMNASRPEVIARFAERIPFLESLFPDYGRRVIGADEATYATARNVPVFHAVTGWRMDATREERIAQMVDDIRRMAPAQRPAFLHAFVLNWFCDLPMLKEVVDRLGPNYVAVRPDHLAELWREDMRRRQVCVRLLPTAAGVEGMPLALQATLRNMTDAPLAAHVAVEGGLRDSAVAPADPTLQPARDERVLITGAPEGNRVSLIVTGGFGTQRAEVALRTIWRREVLGSLPDVRALIPAAYLEAEQMPHIGGSLAKGEAASDGAVWSATPDRDKPSHVVYGPYAMLEAGHYLALFRVERVGKGTGVLATLDTAVAGTSGPQTGVRQVRCEELPEGEWRWIPIVFDHPGGQYEARVLWSGAAGIAVDAIALWRLP